MAPLYCITIPAGIGLVAISQDLRARRETSQKPWIGVFERSGRNARVLAGVTAASAKTVSSFRERLGARGVAAMNLCKCPDLDRADGRPELRHDLVFAAR